MKLMETIIDLLLLKFMSKTKGSNIFILTLFIGLIIFLLISLFLIYLNSKNPTNKTLKEGKIIISAINEFQSKNHKLPENLNELVGNNPLKKDWLKDEWNTPYYYKASKNDFSLISFGKDKLPNTQDDLKIKH